MSIIKLLHPTRFCIGQRLQLSCSAADSCLFIELPSSRSLALPRSDMSLLHEFGLCSELARSRSCSCLSASPSKEPRQVFQKAQSAPAARAAPVERKSTSRSVQCSASHVQNAIKCGLSLQRLKRRVSLGIHNTAAVLVTSLSLGAEVQLEPRLVQQAALITLDRTQLPVQPTHKQANLLCRSIEKINASSDVDGQIWRELGNCLTETDLGIGTRTVVRTPTCTVVCLMNTT